MSFTGILGWTWCCLISSLAWELSFLKTCLSYPWGSLTTFQGSGAVFYRTCVPWVGCSRLGKNWTDQGNKEYQSCCLPTFPALLRVTDKYLGHIHLKKHKLINLPRVPTMSSLGHIQRSVLNYKYSVSGWTLTTSFWWVMGKDDIDHEQLVNHFEGLKVFDLFKGFSWGRRSRFFLFSDSPDTDWESINSI